MQKYCFRRPRSRNKSVFHDIYICPKGTELSFLWRIYTSRGSSNWIVVGAYYGRIIITPGLKGLKHKIILYQKEKWQILQVKTIRKEVSSTCKFIKNTLWHRCFPVNFTKFLRTPSFIECLGWLLLIMPFSPLKQ